MTKIVESIKHANENMRHYFGFEFFAPTSEAGTITLYDKVERMCSLDPLFCSITWGDYGMTADTSIEVAATCQTLLSVNYQVNLTGYTSTPGEVSKWLSVLRAKGVRNILATRGNVVKPRGDRSCGCSDGCNVHFPHAVDLVRFVRQEFGSYFGIAVVAAPEADNLDEEVAHLREKVDAGADYVITQPIFDAAVFARFVEKCIAWGIRCPILPGILPVANSRQLSTLDLAKRAGAAELKRLLEQVTTAATVTTPTTTAAPTANAPAGEPEERQVIVTFMQELVRALLSRGAGGAYFFTMNSDILVPAIIKGLGLPTHRAFPWKPSENEERRRKETVRPIHWSSRVTSYMVRTAQWKDYQSADKCSTDLWSSSGGYHAKLLLRSCAKRCAQFLTLGGITDIPQALEELCRIFVNFLNGNGTLPWADELSGETAYVSEIILKPLNARGLFTINSQPQVNGLPSDNRIVGWGPRNGYIYQKGYVEFFCPTATAQTVFTTLDRYPALQYMAMDSQAKLVRSNWPMEEACPSASLTAAAEGALGHLTTASVKLFGSGITTVTWGVFPGREVIQPTIVSVDSFRAWVGEAFDLWTAPFPSNDVPPVVQLIQSEWVLLNIVDDTFHELPSPLERAVLEVCSKIPPLIPVGAGPVPPPVGAASPVTGVGLPRLDGAGNHVASPTEGRHKGKH